VGLTIVALAFALVVELPILVNVIGSHIGEDFLFYRAIGERWLAAGPLYLPHQLAGPFDLTLQVDNLYPPHALGLLVPFTVLPAPLWWAIPLGVAGYLIVSWKPAWWAWPLLALLVAWPKTVSSVLWGNMDMWMVAGIAAGLRWGWPALLLTIKPSLAPFALLGIHHRSFWVGAALTAAVFTLMLPMWLDYVQMMLAIRIPVDYSFGSIPTMMLPLVAWASRSVPARRPWRESVRSTLAGWRMAPMMRTRRMARADYTAAATSDGRRERAPSS
jgi:hypothetical protein